MLLENNDAHFPMSSEMESFENQGNVHEWGPFKCKLAEVVISWSAVLFALSKGAVQRLTTFESVDEIFGVTRWPFNSEDTKADKQCFPIL